MEGIGILQHTVARSEVIAIIQIVLERIVGRIRHACCQHLFCDRHVNVRPDRVRSCDVITELRLVEDAVLIRLVVTSAENRPAVMFYIANTLDDCIVLHTLSSTVDWHTLRIEGNHDVVRVGIARHRWLEHAGNTVASLCKNLEFRRQSRRLVFARHGFAWVDDVKSASATDIQLSLEHSLFQHSVERLTWLELDEEVNAVLVSRLPLVDSRPGVSLAVSERCNGRRTRREDQTVRMILELGVQHCGDCLLHRRSIACEEQFGLNAKRTTGGT